MNYLCYIDATYGNFPFCYWHGGYCLNQDNSIIFYDQFQNYVCRDLPIVFDLSNLLIQEEDLKDIKLKTILSIFNDLGNYIRLSNPLFKEILSQ